jgi:hypothetical protein
MKKITKQKKLTREEYSLMREYLKAKEKYETLKKQIENLKNVEEDTELMYKGIVIGRVLFVNSKKLDFSKIPPSLKKELEKFYVEREEKRLIITGVPSESD